MNPVSEGGTSDAPLNMPMKRKRGRPRKDRSLIPVPAASVPPGFARVQQPQTQTQAQAQTQTLQLDAIEDASDSIVGQAVTGVVESVFDAGYCLSVRIGNSSTQFRGLVFKPGHYIPISPENDVAPHVQMLRRNEVQIPTRKQGRPRGRHARSKAVNLGGTQVGQLLNGSPPMAPPAPAAPQAPDIVSAKGKEIALVQPLAAAAPVGLRGTVVPVFLNPVSASNGSPAINLGQAQTGKQILSENTQNNTKGEAEKVQVAAQATEVRNENVPEAVKSSVDRSGSPLGGVVGNLNSPLAVEPLQAVHSSDTRNKQGVSFPMASDNSKIGGMSVLLQALQENMNE